MKRLTRILAILLIGLATVAVANADTATITEWSLPQSGSGPAYLALDGQGGFWFTQQDAARLGHFDPATGTLREWQDPSPFLNFGLSVDDDGFVWLAVWSRALMRFDPLANRFETFDIPTSFPLPFMVHVEGKVCTTQVRRRVVACLDPAVRVWSEWSLPSDLSQPEGLAVTEDGALWLGSNGGRRLARLNRTTNVLTAWSVPGDGALRLQIAQDAVGRIWFPLIEDGALGRLDPKTDEIEIYPLPNPFAEPFAVEVDLLGRVWFTESGEAANAIGRLDLSEEMAETHEVEPEVFTLTRRQATSRVLDFGVEEPTIHRLAPDVVILDSQDTGGFHEWLLPTSMAGPGDLGIDSQGRILFEEYAADKLGMLVLTTDAIVAGIVETLDRIAERILDARTPGAQGLIQKLERISTLVTEASDAFASEEISRAEYRQRLQIALDLLQAFENQLDAKIANAQLGEPDASELPPLVAGIESSILLLMTSE